MFFCVKIFRLPQALPCTSKSPWWSLHRAEGNRVGGPFFHPISTPLYQADNHVAITLLDSTLSALDERVTHWAEVVIGSAWGITRGLRKSGPVFNQINKCLKYELAADSSTNHAHGNKLLLRRIMWICNAWVPLAAQGNALWGEDAVHLPWVTRGTHGAPFGELTCALIVTLVHCIDHLWIYSVGKLYPSVVPRQEPHYAIVCIVQKGKKRSMEGQRWDSCCFHAH